MSVSVVIVTYGNGQQVAQTLSSLARLRIVTTCEVILVDNLGDPELDEVSTQGHIQTKLLRPGNNLGYGGGVNFGRTAASGDWLMILNPDVQIEAFNPKALADPKASLIMGPVSYDGYGRLIPSFSPTFPSALRDPLQELGLVLDGRPRAICSSVLNVDSAVAWISGAAMLMPTLLFDRLAGFDSEFFLYYEDIDLCRRASEVGVEIKVCSDWRIRHTLHSTTTDRCKVTGWRYRSKIRYFRKHCTTAQFMWHRTFAIPVLLLKYVIDVIWRDRLGGNRRKAYLDGIRRYFGNGSSLLDSPPY